jgi:Ca2+-binding EF-hand superfamily protein
MRLDRSHKNYLTDEDIKVGFINFYSEERANFLTNLIYHRHKDRPFRFSEFLAMCTNRNFLINNENTKNLFLTIDDNGNGTVELNELK